MPFKKSKGKALGLQEKTRNQELDEERTITEHIFAYLKKLRILNYGLRNDIKNYNLIFKNITGIKNFPEAKDIFSSGTERKTQRLKKHKQSKKYYSEKTCLCKEHTGREEK